MLTVKTCDLKRESPWEGSPAPAPPMTSACLSGDLQVKVCPWAQVTCPRAPRAGGTDNLRYGQLPPRSKYQDAWGDPAGTPSVCPAQQEGWVAPGEAAGERGAAVNPASLCLSWRAPGAGGG